MKIKTLITLSFVLGLIITSCVKKDFDVPEIPDPCDANPGLTANITVAEIKTIFNSLPEEANGVKSFPADSAYILEAVVVSSDEEGNFYKQIILQDETNPIGLSIDGTDLYNDFNIGQTVMVKLSELYIEKENDLYVLGMGLYDGGGTGRIPVTLLDEIMYRKSCPVEFEYLEKNLIDINPTTDVWKLIMLKDVQFIDADTTETFADAINQSDMNRTIEDCGGSTMIVRTSGYADFAGDQVPTGKGNIIGVLGKHGSDLQFVIRKFSEVQMNSPRCSK